MKLRNTKLTSQFLSKFSRFPGLVGAGNHWQKQVPEASPGSGKVLLSWTVYYRKVGWFTIVKLAGLLS